MPVSAKSYNEFIYVWYKRGSAEDSVRLGRFLEGIAMRSGEHRDVVIDVAGCKGLLSTELGCIIRLCKRFRGHDRCVRLLTNPGLKSSLESTNLHRLENLFIYGDQQSFIEQVRKSANGLGLDGV